MKGYEAVEPIFDELGSMNNTLEMLRYFEQDVIHSPLQGGGGWQRYDCLLTAESMAGYNVDLLDSWLTLARWNMLTRQYLDGPATDHWLELIDQKLTKPNKTHGVAYLRSRVVTPRHSGARASRKWGSCMLGWSFRLFPTPRLTMHSRSTYIGYLADFDLLVAHKLAELAIENLPGLTLADVGFTWHLEQATIHDWRGLPWWFRTPDQHDQLERSEAGAAKGARHMLRRFRKMDREGRLYGDQPFTQERRLRMKLHVMTEVDPKPFLGVGEHAEVKTMPKLVSVPSDKLEIAWGPDDDAEAGFMEEMK